MCGSSGNSTCKSILNMFQALSLSHGKGSCSNRDVNGRGSGYCGSSGGIKSVSDAAKIANMV